MRIASFIPVLCISYATASHAAVGMEAVANCVLGGNGNHTLTLLRDNSIENTAVYYLSKDRAPPVRVYPGDEDQSRGEDLQIACVGIKERAFVLSGEFTSNYLQGVAIRYNTKVGQWERVDFAERERPASVYMDAKGITVLIPNHGRNESSKRYILYRYESGKGEVEQIYSDIRPQSEAVQIPMQRTKRQNSKE